jgi:monofunctional glycosyltransferase
LNIMEASLLASVLPNPHRFQVARPSGYVRFRQSMIQRRSRNVILPKQ